MILETFGVRPSTVEEIEQQSQSVLLDAYGRMAEVEPPIDLNRVTKALRLQVKAGTFSDRDLAGYYDKAARTIYVSRDDPYYRQAFTVAHEIGHFVRHEQLPHERFLRTDSVALATDREIEQEANWFAASLLMPRLLLDRYWPLHRDVKSVAAVFGVSTLAMQYRLQNLGFIDE